MEQSLTTILQEQWRTHQWAYSPPPPFHNIQYIAAALALLYFHQKIDGTNSQPAIEILKTRLPSASAEEITFTFRVLQEHKAFSHGNGFIGGIFKKCGNRRQAVSPRGWLNPPGRDPANER